MMKLQGMIDELFRAMEWSDARMWTAIHRTPAASNDQRVRESVHHLHIVQRSFLGVWRGKPEMPPALNTFADTFAIEKWARTYYAEAHALIESLDDAALERPIELPWAARIAQVAGSAPRVPTLSETLVQVAMHTAHHRAQTSTRIREIGGEPLLVDFIAWIWLGRAAAEWP